VARELDRAERARHGGGDGGVARARVVIGQREHRGSALGGAPPDLTRGGGPVGARGMTVELDEHGAAPKVARFDTRDEPGARSQVHWDWRIG
jgi:hypothetical protein